MLAVAGNFKKKLAGKELNALVLCSFILGQNMQCNTMMIDRWTPSLKAWWIIFDTLILTWF